MITKTPEDPAFPGGFPPGDWIDKAAADLGLVRRLAEDAEHGEAVAFHCQQAVEKLMKAALVTAGVIPPKVHDLPDLMRRLRDAGVKWNWSSTELRLLSVGAVHSRYPGYGVSADEVHDLVAITEAIWASLRPLI